MAEEIQVKKIVIDTGQATDALDDLANSSQSVKENNAGLDKSLGDLPGPLGKVKQGIAALNKGFKALLANPIILIIAGIVAALAGLVKAFTKTQEGADKMAEGMAALSAILDVVVGRLARIFKGLTQIIKGNFKEGFQEIGDAVKGVGDEMREATKAAIEFERATIALFNAETDVLTLNAERRQQIAELVFLTRDQTRSVEERRDAIIQADVIEKAILEDNIKLQQAKIDLAKADIANDPKNFENRDKLRALAEEEARLIDLQTESLTRQRELKNRLNELDNKAAADRKAVLAEETASEEAAEAARVEKEKLASEERLAEKELERQLEEDFNNALLEMDKAFSEQTKAIKEQETDDLIKSSERRFKTEEQLVQEQIANEMLLQQAKESIYQNGVTALLGFLKEGSALAKGVQVADATRTAIITAMQAYKSVIGIPIAGPILAPIAAGAALAVGLANVRKITQTKDPTGAPSPAVPSVNLARPQTGLNTEELTNANQGIPTDVSIIQDSTTRGATKTYVVQSDVTAEQDIAKQREADVTI